MINTKHNRAYILRRLQISDLQYCEMVERGGYIWLERYFSHAPEVIHLSSYSEMWWKWWVNQWNIRDEYFVKKHRFAIWPLNIELAAYNEVHDIEKIHIVPNKWVIKEVTNLINQYEKQLIKSC